MSIVSLLLVMAASLIPSQAKAETRFIDNAGGGFSPSILRASAGDTIVWRNQTGHNVVGFNGAGFGDAQVTLGTTSITFTGGTSWYRCTYHSWEPASGSCIGMCGVITDKPLTAPSPPVVNSPPLSNTLPARVSGTAEAATEILVYRDGVQVTSAIARSDATWQAHVPMSASSSHTIVARARYPGGALSEGSSPVVLTTSASALADSLAPTFSTIIEDIHSLPISGEQPTPPIKVGSPVTIRGQADDPTIGSNVGSGVSHLRVYIIERWSKALREYTPSCLRCPAATVFWSLNVELPQGTYYVFAIVYDRAGNFVQSRFYSFLLVDPLK